MDRANEASTVGQRLYGKMEDTLQTLADARVAFASEQATSASLYVQLAQVQASVDLLDKEKLALIASNAVLLSQ